MSTLAIITARGGSKGVPGKNLRQVGGLSLVARAITAARESGVCDRIAVSSDDPAILEEARRHGAEPILRPAELAGDHARSIDAVLHALDVVAQEGLAVETVILLQPTSPLRTADDIRQAMALFRQTDSGSVISGCACEHHPLKTLVLREGRFEALIDPAHLETPRQQLPQAFRTNGAIYINRARDLRQRQAFLVSPIQFYAMDEHRSMDIDSEADLARAAQLLSEENPS